MRRNLKRLADEPFDLLVIGGGINGVAAAWDGVLRGLNVALVEKGDFGAQTSSATLKIVHGGLRYLQHLDIVRMRESIRERSNLLAIAPHIVEPFPFLVPTYGHLMKGREVMAAAVFLNELASGDRNRRLRDPARRIPAGRVVSARECLELVPGLDRKGLNGGVIFHDAQMHNSERLTLSFALGAAAKGGALANYVEAVGLLREGDRVTGARVRDRLGSGEFEVRARVVVNMTGPWSDILLGLLQGPNPGRRVRRSKGIQIVTPPLTGDIALAVPSRHADPDAVMSRGGRHYFITPWRGASLVGTTDTVYEGDPDDFRITAADIRAFVEEINEALPSARLRPEQVPFAFGGLRPVTEKNIDTGSTVSRKYEITDHAADLGIEGLITVIGVKYTTCRLLAEKVVHRIFEKLDRASPAVATATMPLPGGEIEDFVRFLENAVAAEPELGKAVMGHLGRSYGTGYALITRYARSEPALAQCVPGSAEVLKAEVVHAVREECAVRLEDVVLRRTDLGTLGHPGAAALETCADLMARDLGWDAATRRREIEAVNRRFVFAD
jgi:glycerol-3-phosphate dehydrogenase